MRQRLIYASLGAALALSAAWSVSNLTEAIQQGRQATTGQRLRLISTVLSAYASDTGTYPVSAETDVAALKAYVEPRYVRSLPLQDGWGRPLRYLSSGLSFVVWSNGSDGAADIGSGGGWRLGPQADIVMSESLEGFPASFWSAPANWDDVSGGFGCPDPRVQVADALSRRGELLDLLAAAKRGDPASEFRVGMCSLFGYRLPENPVAASRWLHAASLHGHAGALAMLPLAAQRMTPEQFREGQSQAEGLPATRLKVTRE